MAKAKKLPSGNWNCKVYSHSIPIWNNAGKPVYENGKQKTKRVYESFTAPTKKEAEFLAAQFLLTKKESPKNDYLSYNLSEAIDRYIESRVILSKSPTTIQDYRCIQKYAFQDLMHVQLKGIDRDMLQEAINMESQRECARKKGVTLSPKRLRNEWGLVAAVLHRYAPDIETDTIELPEVTERVPDLIPAEVLLPAIKGTDIELPVLLAAWLSYSMSEVRGLTKSKSISGDYMRVAEVVVVVDGKDVRKETAKNKYRNRTHRIPPYIKELIDKVPGNVLVPMTGATLYHKWIRFLDEHHFQHMTFHDLRHLNASVMALLQIPDKYAQERGGWNSDKVMKKVYMQTFESARIQVDNKIDNFFNGIVTPVAENFDYEKYNAWRVLYEKEDSRENRMKFLKFLDAMQHEMQHK